MSFVPLSRKIQKGSGIQHIPRERVKRAGESRTHGVRQTKTNPQRRKVQYCGLCFRAKENPGKFEKATAASEQTVVNRGHHN